MKPKKALLIFLCALLMTLTVPFTGNAQSLPIVPTGNQSLIYENFEGAYSDSATLTGGANYSGTIAGFTSAMTSSNGSSDSISIVTDSTLSSKVLKFTSASTGASAGVKRAFSSSGISAGQITAEVDFSLTDVTKNSTLLQVLDSSGNIVVDIQNKNNPAIMSGCSTASGTTGSGALVGWATGSSTWCPFGTTVISNNTWYHLKAVLDLNNRQGSYYLTKKSDSSSIGQLLNQPFKNAASSTLYQTIKLSTSKPSSGSYSLSMDNVQVYQLTATPDAPTVSTSAGQASVAVVAGGE